MFFLALPLLVLPYLAHALPQPASPATTDMDITTYHYTFPSYFDHPGIPNTVNFTHAQVNYLAARSPIDISLAGEISFPTNGTMHQPLSVGYSLDDTGCLVNSTAAPAGAKEDIPAVIRADRRCALCVATCTIGGIIGPEGIIVCVAFCLAKSFCH